MRWLSMFIITLLLVSSVSASVMTGSVEQFQATVSGDNDDGGNNIIIVDESGGKKRRSSYVGEIIYYECNDNKDNDGDGLIDFDGAGQYDKKDPGCKSWLDNSEDDSVNDAINMDDEEDKAGLSGLLDSIIKYYKGQSSLSLSQLLDRIINYYKGV